MKKDILLVLIAVFSVINIQCKKDDNLVPPAIWDLSGKIIFNPQGGNLSGVYRIDLNSPNPTLLPIVTYGAEPRVTVDGNTIVYDELSPQRSLDIYSVNISGASINNLTNDTIGSDSWPDWSPDGSLIAFNRVFYPGFKEAICMMNKDGSNLHNLTDTSLLAVAVMPRWSPDGTKIAFMGYNSSTWSLYIVLPDGQNLTVLDQIGTLMPPTFPIWLPDSRKIAYGKTADHPSDLYIIDVDNKSSTKITASGVNLISQGVSCNSNGKLICVGKNNTSSSGYGIYLYSPSTLSVEKTLALGFEALPTTCSSSGGKHIAIFGTTKIDTAFALYVVDVDGNNFRKLKDIDNSKTFITDWQDCQWLK